jgi:hypothetical protein
VNIPSDSQFIATSLVTASCIRNAKESRSKAPPMAKTTIPIRPASFKIFASFIIQTLLLLKLAKFSKLTKMACKEIEKANLRKAIRHIQLFFN